MRCAAEAAREVDGGELPHRRSLGGLACLGLKGFAPAFDEVDEFAPGHLDERDRTGAAVGCPCAANREHNAIVVLMIVTVRAL